MKTLKKILKWLFGILFGLIALWTIAAAVIVSYVIPDNEVKTTIHNEINKFVNVKNGYSNAELTFFRTFPNLSLVIDDIYLVDTTKEPADTIFTLDKLIVNLDITSLTDKKLSFKRIELLNPYIHYRIDSNGVTNLDNIISFEKKDSITENPVIYLNNLKIKQFRIKYDNYAVRKYNYVDKINLAFSGKINTRDSLLDISYGELFIDDNSIDFDGHISNKDVDLKLSYQLNNIPRITRVISTYTRNKELQKTEINGNFNGIIHLAGQLRDTTKNTIKVHGTAFGNNIYIRSSKNKILVRDGSFDIDFVHDIIHKDSLRININSFDLQGDNIYLTSNGSISYYNNDFHIDGSINSNGDLTKLSNQTALLGRGISIKGKYDLFVQASTSLDSLKHCYDYPKSINTISTSSINIPNIYGQIELSNLIYNDREKNISSDNLTLFVDGTNGTIVKSKIDEIRYKTKKMFITAKGSDISLDGKKMKSSVLVSQIGYLSSEQEDTILVQAKKIDIKFSPKGGKIANGAIEEITYRKGDNNIFGAKIYIDLLKKNLKNKKTLWDAIESKIFIATFKNNELESYGKILKGHCIYENKASDLKVTSDSLDIKLPGNELFARNLAVDSKDISSYNIGIDNISSRKLDFDLPLNISSLSAYYGNKHISLTTGLVNFGQSKISLDAKVSLENKNKTKLTADIKGDYLNINEIMIAQNMHALAEGNPYAIPLDSIPEGAIPRGIGNEKNDLILNLNLKKFTLSSLNLDNTTGTIIIKGNEILLNKITSNKDNGAFQLSSLFRYINPDYSTTTVSIDAKNFSMARLGELLPQTSNTSPMLSALEGSLDFTIDMFNTVRHVILIDLSKSKVAATLQARNLAISNNEEFSKIAKTLKFKNRTRTEIDSLAVAAQIDDGQVKILPFMLKVDRYKVAVAGENNLGTNEIDYHISVLKSPVPFKFGIDITGNKSPYKTKIVKTLYKKLDPNVKPWTDTSFSDYRNSITYPISAFKTKYLNE